MKTLRKQCAVVILTLTMAVSTYAGILQCPGAVGDNGNGNGNTASQVAEVITPVIVVVVTALP